MRASITCRFPSRTATKHRPITSPATKALPRASGRWPKRSSSSACRSPSIWWCIAPILAASNRWLNLRWRLAPSRVEIAHVQYYGWALKNRAALMPTREQVEKPCGRSKCCGPSTKAASSSTLWCRIIMRGFPSLASAAGAAARSMSRRRPGASVPCGGGHSRSRILECARAFACRHLADLAGISGFPWHRLDAGAVQIVLPARSGFRRLPVPGLPTCGRCPCGRSGMSPVAASCAGRATGGRCAKMPPTAIGTS